MCLSTCYFPALKNESDIFTINCTLVDYCYTLLTRTKDKKSVFTFQNLNILSALLKNVFKII